MRGFQDRVSALRTSERAELLPCGSQEGRRDPLGRDLGLPSLRNGEKSMSLIYSSQSLVFVIAA